MDLLSSTIFHIIIFPKQVVACFINFSHVELITSHIFRCFCHLSIYLPLYFPREMEQLIEMYPSSSPFHSCPTQRRYFFASLYILKACLRQCKPCKETSSCVLLR